MKKYLIFTFIMFSLFILASCGNKDEEAEELIQYNNDKWVPINEVKKEKLNEPENKLTKVEDEGKDEEASTVIEDEIIPILDDIQNEFKAVELKHKKIKKLNELEIEAEEFLIKTMEEVVIHYKGGNVSEEDLNKNNNELEEKFQEVIDYRYELMDKYDLEYVEDDESLGNFRNLKHKEK